MTLATCLTGCDNNTYASPVSLRRVGDTVEVAVCRDIDAQSVRITQSFSQKGQPYGSEKPFFVASGAATFHRGDVIVAGAPIEGMRIESSEDPALHSDDILQIYIGAQSVDPDMHSLFGPLDEEPVTSSAWTWIDGETSTDACPRAD
jgi:hypothetical protein